MQTRQQKITTGIIITVEGILTPPKQFSFIVFYTGNSTGNSNCYHVKRIPKKKKKRKKAEKFFVDVYSPFIM